MGRRGKLLGVMLLAASAAATLAMAACDDSSNAVKETLPGKDSGAAPAADGGPLTTTDGGPLPDGAPGDCVQNPKTHEEIINGCTDAVKITKNPHLPLLAPDGGLPPLP